MTSMQSGDQGKPVAGQVQERLVYLVQESARGYHDGGAAFWPVLRAIWDHRWLVVLITAVFGSIGVAYALFATPWYSAEVTVLPRDSKSGSGLSSQLAQLGGLANLAGINLSPVGKEEPVAVLKSHGFARQFIENNGLLTVLLADDWDAGRKTWKGNPPSQPDIRDAVKFFEEDIRTVAEDRKTGLLTVAVEWTDPVQAAAWANSMVKQVNEEMRKRALKEAQSNVRFLQEELRKSDVISLQQALGHLLESEMQKLMLAQGNEDFSFKVVDRAEPPKNRSKPRRAAIVFLAFLAGWMVGIAAVLVRQLLRQHHKAASVVS